MYHQWEKRGFATAVDTLMDCGVLTKQAYEKWRFGKEPYLERCCTINLSKLTFILHQMQLYGKKSGWKVSFCYYKQWGMKKRQGQGHKQVLPLRFSKSGNVEIERKYATHYVDADKIYKLKEQEKAVKITK